MITTGRVNMDKARRNEIKEVVYAYLSNKMNDEEALRAAAEKATVIMVGVEANSGVKNSKKDIVLYTAIYSSIIKFDQYRAQINQDFFEAVQDDEMFNTMLRFIQLSTQKLLPKLNNIYIEWVVMKQGVFEQYRVQDLDLQTLEVTEILK
ncbi:hypothetical protein [Geofilum rubicundum]|uniref:hypothetical protein n=1 Tax=Geofilum rubicundum TaxID=472113 RepID=UPI0007834D11|nr:hypothetical protein [Geofilum rubicundum]